MQVTETLSDGLKRAYAIVVPAADIEGRRMARLTSLGKQLRLPGFRPGKVPMPVIKQRYGVAVSAEIADDSVNEATRKVVEDNGLRPAMQPKVEGVDVEAAKASPAVDLAFTIELELLPEIAMPDFASVNLTRLKAEVAAAAVDEAIASMAARARELVELTEEDLAARGENAGAAEGDVLTVDFLGKIDDVAFEGGTASDIDVDIGGSGFIPGFAEQLVGAKAGEARTIAVTFPAEYGAPNLAGKAATFDVTVKQHRKGVPGAIDDTLAQKMGLETLEELRTAITERMQAEYDRMARQRVKRLLLDALADMVSFPTPDTMTNQEFDQIWQRLTADKDAGKLDAEDLGKDDDTLRAEYRGIAERRVRLGLLLAEIGRVNGIAVTPDELTRAMRVEAGRYPGQEAQMMEFFQKYPQMTESLRGPIFEEKVVDFVLELVKLTDEVVTPEELAKEPDAPKSAASAIEAE
ncbi:MAG: trigger factor [Rhodospirillales bacterium]